MTDMNLPHEDGERTIKFTISLDDKPTQTEARPEPETPPLFADEARLFEVANLLTVTGERNTEHGLTTVRLIEFRDEAQRQKIINLLAESFQQVAQQLIPYLYRLGAHPRASVRRRAAETVGMLMCDLDFIRYKQEILLPWALSDNLYLNTAVGVALATVAKDSRYAENVKALLKHWATSSNPSLNWTALASSVQLGSLWPEDTFELLEISLKRDWLDLLILANFVVRQLCHEGHTDLLLARLSEWISDRKANLSLRNGALLIFLEVIQLAHVADSRHLLDDAVDIFLIGLSDRGLAGSGLGRTAMLEKLKAWAEESFDDPQKQSAMETLMMRMHLRAETQRDKDRIAFHLKRWYQKDKRFAEIARGLV